MINSFLKTTKFFRKEQSRNFSKIGKAKYQDIENTMQETIKLKKDIDKIVNERLVEMSDDERTNYHIHKKLSSNPERNQILKDALQNRNDYNYSDNQSQTNKIDEHYDNDLVNIFIEQIKENEYISLHEFFSQSLRHPKHGYQMKNSKKIGNQIDESDFITAPECSSLFGELLGNFLLYQQQIGINNKLNLSLDNWNLNQSLFSNEHQEDWTIVEIGGGTGFNISNILNSIMKQDMRAFKKSKLILIEKSPQFRKKQIAAIKSFMKSIQKMSIKVSKVPDHQTDPHIESQSIIKDLDNPHTIDNDFQILILSDLRSFRIDYDSHLLKNVRDQGFIKNIDLKKQIDIKESSQDHEGLKALTKSIETEQDDEEIQQAFTQITTVARQDGPIFFTSNEVFDALPVYTFEWDGNTWQEVVVELNTIHERQKGNQFQTVLKHTPVCGMLMKNTINLNVASVNKEKINKLLNNNEDQDDSSGTETSEDDLKMDSEKIDMYNKQQKDLPVGTRIERSVEACEFLADMCRFVWLRGGGVLTIDQGTNHSLSNSIRGIRSHQFVDDWLNTPGTCDLSAQVDFNLLKHICTSQFGDRLDVHGPICQLMFFEGLGIMSFWESVKASGKQTPEQLENMKMGLNRILNRKEMGEIYKVLQINSHEYNGREDMTQTQPFNEVMMNGHQFLEDYEPNL